jgi:hypothetical protein
MTEKFLINTLTAWDEPPRARHQVAHALAEMHQVVFVTRNRFGLWGMEVEQVHERFTLITPSYPMDFRLRIRIPVINAMYQRWLYRRLERRDPREQQISQLVHRSVLQMVRKEVDPGLHVVHYYFTLSNQEADPVEFQNL